MHLKLFQLTCVEPSYSGQYEAYSLWLQDFMDITCENNGITIYYQWRDYIINLQRYINK